MKLFLDDVKELNYADEGLDPKEWTVVKTAKEAFDHIMSGKVTEASLDHDLGSGWPDGTALMRWLMEAVHLGKLKSIPRIHIHSFNPDGAKRMRQLYHTIESMLKRKREV